MRELLARVCKCQCFNYLSFIMKKNIIITIIILAVLGLGFMLYKVSPQPLPSVAVDFNLSGVGQVAAPSGMLSDDHVLGNPEAKNTIVAYEDLQCPACANYEPILKSFATELNDTKVIFRHFPLLTIHKNAALAALASESASVQGKFWEYSDELYTNQSEWQALSNPIEQFTAYAQQVGVPDIEKFKKELIEQTYKGRVERDLREALGLGVNATPTLYFNGSKIEVDGLDSVKQQVEPLYIK